MIRRLLALFALTASLLVGTSTVAHACSCSNLTPAETVKNAQVVFTGTVVEVRTDDEASAVTAVTRQGARTPGVIQRPA